RPPNDERSLRAAVITTASGLRRAGRNPPEKQADTTTTRLLTPEASMAPASSAGPKPSSTTGGSSTTSSWSSLPWLVTNSSSRSSPGSIASPMPASASERLSRVASGRAVASSRLSGWFTSPITRPWAWKRSSISRSRYCTSLRDTSPVPSPAKPSTYRSGCPGRCGGIASSASAISLRSRSARVSSAPRVSAKAVQENRPASASATPARQAPPRSGFDFIEGLDPPVAAGGVAGARLGVILAAVDQHGVHARLAGGVELRDHVGQEQHLPGRHVEAGGDAGVAAGLALGAGFGFEPGRERRTQVAGVRVREEQHLRRHRAG